MVRIRISYLDWFPQLAATHWEKPRYELTRFRRIVSLAGMNAAFGVGILFFERLSQTIECIESVASRGIPVYVLNNGSAPETVREFEKLTEHHRDVRLFHSGQNLGVARGRNFLIREMTEPYLFFIDSDITMATADWVERISLHLMRLPEIEAIIPRVYNKHDDSYIEVEQMNLDGDILSHQTSAPDAETNMFPGGAVILKRAVFDRLGSYDERMFVGLEDYELAVRALRAGAGIRALGVADVVLVHDHRVPTTSLDHGAARVRYDTDLIQNSYDVLVGKHLISYESGWKNWVDRQKQQMGLSAGPELQ